MISCCSSAPRSTLLPAHLGSPCRVSRDCSFTLGSDSAPRSCFLLQLFPAMPQLMHIPALLLLGSFSSCPSCPMKTHVLLTQRGSRAFSLKVACRDAQTRLTGVQQRTVERSPFAGHAREGISGILHRLFYCKYADTCHLQPPPLLFI